MRQLTTPVRIETNVMEFFCSADDLETYVFHPINAFHLMKRASNFWPRLKKLLQESNHDLVSGNNEIIFPEKTDFLKGASFGLVNLQIMHQLNTSEMIRGNFLTSNRGLESTLSNFFLRKTAISSVFSNKLDVL